MDRRGGIFQGTGRALGRERKRKYYYQEHGQETKISRLAEGESGAE